MEGMTFGLWVLLAVIVLMFVGYVYITISSNLKSRLKNVGEKEGITKKKK
jgi:hypothetical protein